jgi:hypothetical protein
VDKHQLIPLIIMAVPALNAIDACARLAQARANATTADFQIEGTLLPAQLQNITDARQLTLDMTARINTVIAANPDSAVLLRRVFASFTTDLDHQADLLYYATLKNQEAEQRRRAGAPAAVIIPAAPAAAMIAAAPAAPIIPAGPAAPIIPAAPAAPIIPAAPPARGAAGPRPRGGGMHRFVMGDDNGQPYIKKRMFIPDAAYGAGGSGGAGGAGRDSDSD